MPAIRIKLPKTDIFMMKITVRQELYLNFVPSTNPKPVMIIVESKRKKMETLEKEYPGAIIIDVTSHADNEFVQFSPFYPHGGIPVPFTDYISAESVEGIWQGLKVFENYNIDTSKFRIKNMKDIKRTTRKYGKCLGHRKGIRSTELLEYIEARKKIYLPSYKWVLDNKLQKLVTAIRVIAKNKPVVLLDYETNADVNDFRKPLSHASLIKAYIEGNYPE